MGKIDFQNRVQAIKNLERKELKRVLKEHGRKTEDGYESNFSVLDSPVIAGYFNKKPCNIIVWTVTMDERWKITLIGEDKNNRGDVRRIGLDNIFAGQLEYVINAI